VTIETIGLLGFVFGAATLAAMAYERRMDVLHGPYLEALAGARPDLFADRFWTPLQSALEHMRWKARNMVYLTSLIAC
jgi:hypothetical protein